MKLSQAIHVSDLILLDRKIFRVCLDVAAQVPNEKGVPLHKARDTTCDTQGVKDNFISIIPNKLTGLQRRAMVSKIAWEHPNECELVTQLSELNQLKES